MHMQNGSNVTNICVSPPSVLEKKLNESETEKFNIKQKAAQLATEIVG